MIAMNHFFVHFSKRAMVFCAGLLFLAVGTIAQAPAEKSQEKPADKSAEKPTEKTEEPPNAAQIELLETKYRFETNGDSRKEVHAIVKINSELGVRQFARLNFDYNRSFQSVEIPLARITHANGGTSDILPSAIADAPNPAVEKFPAYHDVRVKSVRILGLQPGDSLEYRVTTATEHHPLAPNFWISHSFDHTGVASRQSLEISVPKSREIQLRVSPNFPANETEESGVGIDARRVTRWNLSTTLGSSSEELEPDVVISTFASWQDLVEAFGKLMVRAESGRSEILQKSSELSKTLTTPESKTRAIYNFVSKKISTVDLPLEAMAFRMRQPEEILSSGYATAEDKFVLFRVLVAPFEGEAYPAFVASAKEISKAIPIPSAFSNLLVVAGIPPKLRPGGGCGDCEEFVWLDPSVEVAPFRVIPASLRGKEALFGGAGIVPTNRLFWQVPNRLPFASTQKVRIAGTLGQDGALKTRVNYVLRGDNELLLRVVFHKTPTDKQKEIGQYLALSDGFRGKVTSVKTSDPYDTDKPFEVEYELTQEKFVDWSKKPVRIPALLPLPGLPDVTKKPAANSKIELGTPLDISLTGTLRLPPGTLATAPAGTSVKRDYAAFSSTYSSKANVLNFSRHLNFLLPEIPSERLLDLNAFIHAVQSDQGQLFVLDKPDSIPPAKPK
jgi:hypothetical protein